MRQPNDVLSYLPEVFKGIKEFKVFANCVNPELQKAWKAVESAFNDLNLYDMGEDKIKRWEKILNVQPMGTDTIEDRRFRIINRLNSQLPYSYRMLESHLIQMCGENGYTINYNAAAFLLTVKIALTSKKQFAEVLVFVEEMIPANVVLDYDLLYNQYSTLMSFTHGALTSFTYGAMRDEVIS